MSGATDDGESHHQREDAVMTTGRAREQAAGAFTPAQVAAIKARAAALGYHTPTALARAVGVKHPTVLRWFSGERAPNGRHQQELAAVLELPWPTDFVTPPAPALPPEGTPLAGPNVYGTTREVYTALGFLLRPVYRSGTRLDLRQVGEEAYPLPVAERPVPPERARQVGRDGWVLLQGGNAMAGRLPEPALDNDHWWIIPVARGAPRPGDLVAAWVEDNGTGEEAGVLLRSYDLDPETGSPWVYAEPRTGTRVPVRASWEVLGVALFAERSVSARHDA